MHPPQTPKKRIRAPFDERVLALSIKLQKKHPSSEGWKIAPQMRVKFSHQMMPQLFPENSTLGKKFREFTPENNNKKEKEIGSYFVQKNGGDREKAMAEIQALLKELPSRREQYFGTVEKLNAGLRLAGQKAGLEGKKLEIYVDHSIQNILIIEQLAQIHLSSAQTYIGQNLC